jgi:pimeloyl-ACP methyl ester carboxylesterase
MEARQFLGHNVSLMADVDGNPEHPAVLLLHGGGQTRHAWKSTQRRLVAAGYYAVTLDLRGHGDSDWSDSYSLEQQVLDLRAVISQLPTPASKPTLVGASLGGLIALVTAGEAEEPIASGLVLVDVAPQVEPAGEARIRAFMNANPRGFADIDEAARIVATYLPNRPRPASTSGLERNLRLRGDGRYYWHWDPALFDTLMTGAAQERMERHAQAARRLTIPTLLVRGQLSDLVSMDGVRHFMTLIPDAEWTDVAGLGHMIAGDQNDAFSAAVIRFLDKHRHDRPDRYSPIPA